MDQRAHKRIVEAMRSDSIESLLYYLSNLGKHDPTLIDHVRNVANLAGEIAWRAGLSQPHIRHIRLAGLLHDIGKLLVPRSILAKYGVLTADERQVLESHAETGWQMIHELPWGSPIAAIVRGHHERWDGAGYPDRLREHEIPLGSRILAVADTLDAITTDRPYRKARTFSIARAEIASLGGTQFDPAVVEIALSIPDADWSLARHSKSVLALAECLQEGNRIPPKPVQPASGPSPLAVAS
jgi:putative nucleotidyltransferase with HDIG domain